MQHSQLIFTVHHFIFSMISSVFPPKPSSSACPPYSHGFTGVSGMAALLSIFGCLGFISVLALLAFWIRAIRKNIAISQRRHGGRRGDPDKIQEEEEEGRGGECSESYSPKSSVLPARLPLIKYEAMEGGESGCSICRKSFKEGEPCRVMHECGHKFHYLCVDPLVIKPTACPICRMSHLPFVYQMCAWIIYFEALTVF